jgi:hypothetical protein
VTTLDHIKSNFAEQFATTNKPPRHFSHQVTSSVTTVSYQSGRRTCQTEEVRKRDGIVAGMIGPKGRKVVTFGDTQVLNGDTLFEIGSITKVFTALLLSDMVQRDELALTDPVAKFLPAGVNVPQRNGRRMTLVDLATHSSGLPSMPSNMKRTDPDNPFSVTPLAIYTSFYPLTSWVGTSVPSLPTPTSA